MQKFSFYLTFLITLLLLSACTTQKTEQINLGWIGPLTGDFAIIGTENLRGVEIAVDEINSAGGIGGEKVKLFVEDDQMDEKKTLNSFVKLAEVNDVQQILAVNYGGILALAGRVDEDRIILINSLDTSEEIANAGEYVFGVGIYDEGIGFKLAEFVFEGLGKASAGIIYNNVDPFVLLVVDSFTQKFAELGGNIAVKERYEPEDKTFRTQITKVKDAGVDIVLVVGYDEAGLVLRQSDEIGLKATFLGIDTVTSEGFKKNAGEAYEGIYFTSWEATDADAEADFLEKYQKKYQREPEQLLFAATGYDATHMLAKAMQESDLSSESIKNSLYAISGFPGLTGTLTMSKDGIVRTVEEKIYQIQDGAPVKVGFS